MKLAYALPVLALVGCQSVEDLQATAHRASDFQICRAVILAPGDVASIARGEAARRGLDCRPYVSAVVANDAARDAAMMNLGQQLMQPRAPAMMPMPQQTHCRTVFSGNVARTVCN